MAKINNSRKQMQPSEDVEKMEHFCTVGGIANCCSHSGKSMRLLKRLKIGLPYEPAIALLGIYPKDKGVLIQGHMYPNVYSSAINNSQTMERAQMSID